MRYLAERGRGVSTPTGPVPIVPTAVLYDLAVGAPIWPTAEHGYAAANSAVPLHELTRGPVGVGCGATTGKVLGTAQASPGGVGVGRCDIPGSGSVTAIVAVNAAGVVAPDAAAPDPRAVLLAATVSPGERMSTTLAVVIMDVPGDERSLRRAAVAAHDGMARRILPCHTIIDGDIVFAVGLRRGTVAPGAVLAGSVAAELAVERAIVDAIDAAHRG
jgi:L-aminopeptidase/D-esterase-like protein